MTDKNLHSCAQGMPMTGGVGAAAELADAMGQVQGYVDAMQHRYVSEDTWWKGFAHLFMELDRQLEHSIALEIAVDQLLSRQGSTSWSVRRAGMTL